MKLNKGELTVRKGILLNFYPYVYFCVNLYCFYYIVYFIYSTVLLNYFICIYSSTEEIKI